MWRKPSKNIIHQSTPPTRPQQAINTMQHKEACTAFLEQLAAILAASKEPKRSSSQDNLTQLCSDGILRLLQLKDAHKSLAERLEQFRQRTRDSKTQDGKSSLQLYNIEYEAAQHNKEVKSCRAFTSAYGDDKLALPHMDEFIARAPIEMRDDDTIAPHNLELERLTHELEERQQLQTQEAKLHATRSRVGDELEEQRSKLRRLGQQLQAVGAAGQALVGSLLLEEGGETHTLLRGGVTVAAKAQLLPVPLYVLYSQALAAKSAHTLDMAVDIHGDPPQNNDTPRDGQQSTHALTTNVDHRQKEQHPLTVQVTLLHEGQPAIGVVFAYLPALRVVTAAPTDAAMLQVLGSLYPGDVGRVCPNPAFADVAWEESVDGGRPYRWAQQLAGLDFLPPLPTTTHTEDTTALEHNIPTYRTQQRMVHVLTRLRQRAQAHAALTHQLNTLLNTTLPLHPTSFRNITKLVKFERYTSSESRYRSTTHSPPPVSTPRGVLVTLDTEPPSPRALEGGGQAMSRDVTPDSMMEFDYLAAGLAHPSHPTALTPTDPNPPPTPTPAPTPGLPFQAPTRVYRATFRHTEAMEVVFRLVVSDAHPEVLPVWRLSGVTSVARATSATTRRAQPLSKTLLVASRAELATEINVRVPQRVPADKRNEVLSYQVVALVRALDFYKTMWFGDEASKERVPTRGPDRHPALPTSLLYFASCKRGTYNHEQKAQKHHAHLLHPDRRASINMADKEQHDLRGNQPTTVPDADLMAVSPTLAGADTSSAKMAEPGDYKQEVRGSSWRIERTADREAIEEQLQAGDEDAGKVNDAMDRNDPDYNPEKDA